MIYALTSPKNPIWVGALRCFGCPSALARVPFCARKKGTQKGTHYFCLSEVIETRLDLGWSLGFPLRVLGPNRTQKIGAICINRARKVPFRSILTYVS